MAANDPIGDLQNLHAWLATILRQHPDGLCEFELLKSLQAEFRDIFPEKLFHQSHAMFQAHFLLFHALYRLDDELRRSSGDYLEIDVLCIRLNRLTADNGSVPVKCDPMRDYYSDLDNLKQISADDVEQLLGAFWVRYYANEQRTEALTVLGLCDPVEMDIITKRYRELAMEHHPDRGGKHGQFQKLQEAISVLRRC